MNNHRSLPEIKIKDLVDSISAGKTIPIIGYELLRISCKGKRLSLLEFLAYEYLRKDFSPDELRRLEFNPKNFDLSPRIKSDDPIQKVDDIPIEMINEVFRSRFSEKENEKPTGIEIIHGLYYNIYKNYSDKAENFKVRFVQELNLYRETGLLPQLHASLQYLSLMKPFQLYINATIFKSFQLNLMNSRSLKDQEVKVFGYNPAVIYPELKITQHPADPINLQYILPQLTIFNLFDTTFDPYFVLTESEYVELIRDLFINKNNEYGDLRYLLSKCSLLFIGCSFRDWFLRYFLRFCSDSREKYEQRTKKSYLIDDYEKDNNLVFFMQNTSIQTSSKGLEEFITDLYLEMDNRKLIAEKTHRNFIFLSFCSEDRIIADQIGKQLKSFYSDAIQYSLLTEGHSQITPDEDEQSRLPLNPGFWFDKNDLTPGMDIDKEIGQAIQDCSIVVPIVTSNIQKYLNSYFWKEWDFAVKANKKIIPVKVGNYDQGMILQGCRINPEEGVRQTIIKDDKLLGIKIPDRETAQRELPLKHEEILKILNYQFDIRIQQINESV